MASRILTCTLALCLSGAMFVATSCNELSPRLHEQPDEEMDGTQTCLDGVDKAVDFDSAIDLGEGKQVLEYLCPRGDMDYYKLQVPPGQKLTNVRLVNSSSITKVDLTYQIYTIDPSGKERLVARASPDENDPNNFDAIHCTDPGTYYVVVQDQGDDDYDGKNPYSLEVTTEADKDTNEDNNTAQQASQITGNTTGYISCAEDVDYYAVNVPEGQLLEVELKPSAPTNVDLKYVIYDAAQNQVAEAAIPDGMRPGAGLKVIHALPGSGTFHIAVQDSNNAEADPLTAYTLSTGVKPEPDANDLGGRNDSPATATILGSGAGTDKTVKGQLASKADVDYFVVQGLENVSEDNPAVMEVTLTFSPGQVPIDPAFVYMYGHEGTSCTKDNCCRVLATDPCTGPLDCLRQTYSCVSRGDVFCTDPDCAPAALPGCSNERYCAGAAVCLPSQRCGAEYAMRYASNQDGQSTVTTSQLLTHPGPWFVSVYDMQNDEYEYGRSYDLRVRVRMDPDQNEGRTEPDNEIFPDLCLLAENKEVKDISWDLTLDQAHQRKRNINWDTWYSGYLSYEGDVDFFELPNPGGGDWTLTLDFETGSGCPQSGPRRWCEDPSQNQDKVGLEFFYTLRKGTSGWFSVDRVFKPGESGSWGAQGSGQDRKCFYAARHGGSYWLSVEDWNNNSWSWSCNYRFRIRKSAGCNSPCTISYDKCSMP